MEKMKYDFYSVNEYIKKKIYEGDLNAIKILLMCSNFKEYNYLYFVILSIQSRHEFILRYLATKIKMSSCESLDEALWKLFGENRDTNINLSPDNIRDIIHIIKSIIDQI